MSTRPASPAGLRSRPPRRSRLLAITVVGTLSLLVSAFYPWVIRLAEQADPSLTLPPAWAYGAWVTGTVASAVLLW